MFVRLRRAKRGRQKIAQISSRESTIFLPVEISSFCKNWWHSESLYPVTPERYEQALWWLSYDQVPSVHRMEVRAVGRCLDNSLKQKNERVGTKEKLLHSDLALCIEG